MERNLDRKTLSFGKGMTNVPSDLLSDDTELAESNGFIYRDGEMKPIQEAKVLTGFGVGETLLYVHKAADYKNLIGYNMYNNLVCYIYNDGDVTFEPKATQNFNLDGVTDVNSVGNTLLVTTSDGIHYFLFKNGKYKDLGSKLPELNYKFYFRRPDGNYTQEETERTIMNIKNCVDVDTNAKSYYDNKGNFLGAGANKPSSYFSDSTYAYFKIKTATDGKYTNEFQETVQGHVAEAINWAKSKNMFAFPFFLRCAFRLFDGSFARITTPIVCYPSVNKNCRFSSANFDRTYNTYVDLNQMMSGENCFYFMEYKELFFLFGEIKEEWRDIVKEIVVFASDQVLPFYLDRGWKFVTPDNMQNKVYANSAVEGYEEKTINYNENGFGGKTIRPHDEIQPTYKSDSEIINELISKSQFYKLFSIGAYDSLVGGSTFHSTTSGYMNDPVITRGLLENLTTQEQLGVDDYYGWANMTSDKLFSYNNRIHLVGAKRYPFRGFNKFVGRRTTNNDLSGNAYVHIVSSSSDTWVMTGITISQSFLRGWFYYPDPNATEAILYFSGKYVRFPLKVHNMLNGAYSFTNLPSSEGDASFAHTTLSELQNIMTSQDQPEILNSQIFTSVVNNPFVFEASGDNMVGTGKILGIAANTEAVSQGQHGYAPLIVFTSEGMYALKTNSEGLYVGIDPLPRDVCNNADSITPIDNYVIFTSDKGLMAATGGSSACLSEQMRGRTPRNFTTIGSGKFLDFLKGCLIAYDYRDSILRIFKKCDKIVGGDEDITDEELCYYIYDLKEKTFSMGRLEYPIKAVVNDYPDNLIQDTGGYIYSLTGKPDINDDDTLYSGGFTTRPLKLGGSMSLKSIRAIKHLYDSDGGKVKLNVYGSNDCKHWVKQNSLGGKPWKYFTFQYKLTNFKACDSFAGSIVEVQSRREDKMR